MFAPGSQKLECDFCGGSFSLDELKSVVDELEKESVEPQSQDIETTDETVNLEHLDAIEGAEESQTDNIEFTCNACGGKILSDKNTAATFCPFCGSPALVSQRLTGEFKPKYIIPFTHDREAAVNAFLKWCKGGKYTPFGFVSDKNIQKITGLYVPFWLFDLKADINMSGTAEIRNRKGDYTYVTKYSIERYGKIVWNNIPFDAETRIDDKLMEAIEPFDFSKMVPYDYKYLPGFFADKYDLDSKALMDRAKKRGLDYLKTEVYKTMSGYSSKKITENNKLSNVNVEYALLPVWFMHYKYLGKSYYFAMNGQTGEVAGKLPISNVKKVMHFSVTLAITSMIVRFLLGLIMGGFVG